MGINRITSGFLTDQSVGFLNNNLRILSGLQEKLSSGQNINQPSDDPVGLTRILDLSNTLGADERFSRNIEAALAEVNVVDSVLSNMTGLLHRAKELAVQGANYTNNQDGMDAIALEIDEIINQMVQMGNTNIGGKYVFGGKQTSTPPFDRPAGSDDVNYSGNAPATAWQRPVEISRGVELEINLNGENLLGQVQTITPAPVPPVFSAGSGGVLKTLMELKLDLEAGDQDEIRVRLDELDVDLNNILSQQSRIGSIANRLELTLSRLDERKAVFTRQFADIQNIDMPKLISDMNFQESVFQTSLATTARVLQSSLLDFLR